VDPGDYDGVIADMSNQDGATTLNLRYRLAKKAFEHTAVYDRAIADFLASRAQSDVDACYQG
jgi:phosphoribosylaminoimidazolecarboxamide formyltransferase/IMP cyclohydrolase